MTTVSNRGVTRVHTLDQLITAAAAQPLPKVYDFAKQPPSCDLELDECKLPNVIRRTVTQPGCENSGREVSPERDSAYFSDASSSDASSEEADPTVVSGLSLSRSLSPQRPSVDAPIRKRPSLARAERVSTAAAKAVSSLKEKEDSSEVTGAQQWSPDGCLINNGATECAIEYAHWLKGRMKSYDASLRSMEDSESTMEALIHTPEGTTERITYASKAEVQAHRQSLLALKLGLEARVRQLV